MYEQRTVKMKPQEEAAVRDEALWEGAAVLWCELHQMGRGTWDLQPDEVKRAYLDAFQAAHLAWAVARCGAVT